MIFATMPYIQRISIRSLYSSSVKLLNGGQTVLAQAYQPEQPSPGIKEQRRLRSHLS